MRWGDTFSKAGGGFFPLQRLDRAHTAFLVMVNLVDLVRSLKQAKSQHVIIEMNECSCCTDKKDGLTLIVVEGCYSSARSPCTLRYPLRYFPRPTQPAENTTTQQTLVTYNVKQGEKQTNTNSCVTCSWTSSKSELSSSMKIGTAPASITVFVCMDVPDAMLVSAQAASNCRTPNVKERKDHFKHYQPVWRIPFFP